MAVLLLGGALAGWLIWQGYCNERRAMERHISDAARALASVMEAELSKREALLKGLSVSAHLASGNLEAFDRQARNALAGSDEWIVLIDSHQQQRVNTSAQAGTPLPLVLDKTDHLPAINAGRTYISNLERGTLSGKLILVVSVPVTAPNGETLTLSLAIHPANFTRNLLDPRIAEGWLIALVDRNMIIAGRNRNPEEFVGKTVSESMRRVMSGRTEGVEETVTLDGVPSITAFVRSAPSGWTIVVAAPRSVLFAGAQRLTVQALIAALAAGALAVLFAVWMGRSIIGGIDELVQAGEKLARGDRLQVRHTGIDEIDIVGKALTHTSEALALREAALARARDEALAASRAKDEFLAALSHELRTPLNPVLLLASDAARDPAIPPNIRDVFTTIAKNVAIESHLIDDLLDLTRISSGKLALHLQPVAIDHVIAETVETLRRSIEDKSLALTLALDTGSIVTGDSTRLQQVFWNLLSNAIKFTPPQGKIHLQSRVDATNRQIVVTITDSGIGISDEELARLFHRFAQGDHARKEGKSGYGGLGLGLVIARTLVEMHQGELTATSAGRGHGSTFTVRLPLLHRKPTSSQTPSDSLHPQPASDSKTKQPAKSGRKILLVEDHKPTLQTLEKLLSRRGHEIVSAGTAELALQHASREKFDLVISDIGLPDRTGYDLMQELGTRHALKGIAMSGYGADADRARGKAAGFVLHLTKPVSISSLEDALNRVFSDALTSNNGQS